MKTIQLSMKFLWKYRLWNFLILLFIVLMLTISTITYNIYSNIYEPYIFFKDTPLEKSLFFNGSQTMDVGDEANTYIDTSYL